MNSISLPSIEPISVTGLSTEQTRELIKKAYLDAKIFTDPAKLSIAVSKTSGSSFSVKASITRSVTLGLYSVAFCFAIAIGSGKKSMPVTLCPRLAKKSAFSPVPQPESRMTPEI